MENDELLKHPIIQKHKKILQTLADERVFSVGYCDRGFFVIEECDQWFGHDLTKEECLELSELFKEMSESTD